jgi:CubicO group peptidase (beta-lactamase class C family)
VELLEMPGRRWLYSGGGYSVLQLLVEELIGRPFAFMQTEVLDPLGMTASSSAGGAPRRPPARTMPTAAASLTSASPSRPPPGW